MAFQESILVCLKKYAEFNGRASRSEFWWFTVFLTLVAAALAVLSEARSTVFLIAFATLFGGGSPGRAYA